MDLGVCIAEQGGDFDPKEGPPCHASVAGESAVGFNSVSRLPKDVLWITNLRVEDLNDIPSWRAYLRASDYLGINLKHICIDLNIEASPPTQIANIGVLSSVVAGLYRKYLVDLNLDLRAYPYNLHSSIKEKFFLDVGAQVQGYDQKLAAWVNGCVQMTTECRSGTYNYGPRLCVRDNAYSHACRVFDSPIAKGRHAYLPASRIAPNKDAVLQRLLDMDMFSISRLSKLKPKTGYTSIFGFGQVFANKSSPSEQRLHATNYELAFMSDLFDFEVDEVLLFEAHEEDRGPIADLVHGFDPLNSVGYASMIYYINLIRARTDRWKSPSYRDGTNQQAMGFRSSTCGMVYGVRDRMFTYGMAQKLANCDLSVHSYRNGYVFIDSDHTRDGDLKTLAKINAWMYPA